MYYLYFSKKYFFQFVKQHHWRSRMNSKIYYVRDTCRFSKIHQMIKFICFDIRRFVFYKKKFFTYWNLVWPQTTAVKNARTKFRNMVSEQNQLRKIIRIRSNLKEINLSHATLVYFYGIFNNIINSWYKYRRFHMMSGEMAMSNYPEIGSYGYRKWHYLFLNLLDFLLKIAREFSGEK